MIRAEVVKRFTLNGTIDGHDPIGVMLRVTGGLEPFRLVVVCANLGRGYSPEKFKANVLRIINLTDNLRRKVTRTYVVLLLQEIDEADPAEEHDLLKQWLDPGTTLVGWHTREPIAVSPDVPVRHMRSTLTMRQGTDIGAPEGTGPDRFLTTCVITIEGVTIGLGNQHPHRNLNEKHVQAARRRGRKVTRKVIGELVDQCDLVIHGGDMNDAHYPKSHPRERNLRTRGLDTIRLVA